MIIKWIKIIIFALILVAINGGVVNSSGYALLSNEELIEKSDLIVIGEIIGQIGEEQIPPLGFWVTNWQVQVSQVIKGNKDLKEIIVFTPTRSSISYRLDSKGNNVLLFLNKYGDNYQPPSPQGVKLVTINKNKKSTNLFDIYQISDEDLKEELERYITLNNISFEFEKQNDTKGLLFGMIIGVSMITIIIIARLKKGNVT